MKKSEWLDCQRNEFFPKQKGIPSLVKIKHKNTATLDSARSKKKSKVAVLQLGLLPDQYDSLLFYLFRNLTQCLILHRIMTVCHPSTSGRCTRHFVTIALTLQQNIFCNCNDQDRTFDVLTFVKLLPSFMVERART